MLKPLPILVAEKLVHGPFRIVIPNYEVTVTACLSVLSGVFFCTHMLFLGSLNDQVADYRLNTRHPRNDTDKYTVSCHVSYRRYRYASLV